MRKWLLFFLIILLAVLLYLWYTGVEIEMPFSESTGVELPICKIEEPKPATEPVCTVKIGVINTFYRSGLSCFSGGVEHTRGYEIAIAEINEAGGINGCHVDLVPIEDSGSAVKAKEAVSELADDDEVLMILGAYSSGSTLQAAAEVDRKEIPLLIPSASSTLITSLGYEWVFRINADSSDYIDTAMEFVSTLNDLPTIAVIYENSVFGESAAVAVTSLAENKGISIVAYELYRPGLDKEALKPHLNILKAGNPDVVYLVSNSINDSINLLEASREVDLDPQLFIANAGAAISPDFLEKAMEGNDEHGHGHESLVQNLVATAQWSEDIKDWHFEDGLDGATFSELFRKKYEGDNPGMRSVQTYTSLMLAKMVIEQAKNSDDCDIDIDRMRLCIRDNLRAIELEQTIFGPINFDDATGQNSHPVILVQIVPNENGEGVKFATIYPEAYKSQDVEFSEEND